MSAAALESTPSLLQTSLASQGALTVLTPTPRWSPQQSTARQRPVSTTGVHDRVHHHIADALALPFAAQTFDAVRGERLFQHLSDPRAALAEMLRVTRPGGWIVVLDTDYSSSTVDSDQTDLERRRALAAAQSVRSGYVARKLYRMFTDQGLSDIFQTSRSRCVQSR